MLFLHTYRVLQHYSSNIYISYHTPLYLCNPLILSYIVLSIISVLWSFYTLPTPVLHYPLTIFPVFFTHLWLWLWIRVEILTIYYKSVNIFVYIFKSLGPLWSHIISTYNRESFRSLFEYLLYQWTKWVQIWPYCFSIYY